MIDTLAGGMEFPRSRTLHLLDEILAHPAGEAILGWRPGPGRAHIAWQLMHIAITEELFATDRLNPEREPAYTDERPRFRGGSTPDDEIPTADTIRATLAATRTRLQETLSSLPDDELGEVKFVNRLGNEMTLRQVIHLLPWHESHHHGQAHITFNLFKAQYSE